MSLFASYSAFSYSEAALPKALASSGTFFAPKMSTAIVIVIVIAIAIAIATYPRCKQTS
jgi:hypothetical protein